MTIEASRSRRTSRSQTRVPEGHHSSRHVSSSSQEDSKKPTESEPQIKGILKPPREKFPEDPNPVRPGVAPLKEEAHKKGIPLDARWTRVDRRLVNPEALEGKERFSITDEQPDCVFVLRVLTKEEIQAYAIRTHEIRCTRSLTPVPNTSHEANQIEQVSELGNTENTAKNDGVRRRSVDGRERK